MRVDWQPVVAISTGIVGLSPVLNAFIGDAVSIGAQLSNAWMSDITNTVPWLRPH